MTKQTPIKSLKEGDKIVYDQETLTIKKIETSNIGKHGRSKTRLEAINKKGEKKVIIRPTEANLDTE
jgi:translation elongation factor P/translation initiation factor 5A